MKTLFAIMLILTLVLTVPALKPLVFIPIMLNFVIWSFLGFLLTWVAVNDGIWERLSPPAESV